MKKIIVFLMCVFLIGCLENNGDTVIETGGASAENQSESNSTVEQSQIDELAKLMPELICTDCDQAQVEALAGMYDTMVEVVKSLVEKPVTTPVGEIQNPGISIIIDAYTSAAADLQEGTDTQAVELTFDDTLSDIIDAEMPGEDVQNGEAV